MDLGNRRMEYTAGELASEDLDADPIVQFSRWFLEAEAHPQVQEANAMTLSTANGEEVTARVVLLKGYDEQGFRFFTNYGSQKSQAIGENPSVCLSFFWAPLERQVAIRGHAERLPELESESYFRLRPRESQLGAWASEQSQPIESREALVLAFREIADRFAEQEVPRPPHWGGFLVRPRVIEFWQGRKGRLHDRFEYRKTGEKWERRRLQP